MPRGCLQFVIVVFPDHTHLLFLNMFYGTNLTLNSDVDQDTKMVGPHERSLTDRCIISLYIHINILNEMR